MTINAKNIFLNVGDKKMANKKWYEITKGGKLKAHYTKVPSNFKYAGKVSGYHAKHPTPIYKKVKK